ncbi:hypothetical protein [Muribaculum intestinale]|uniref:hypothetical protein n=1 Tax=Muribaculum intestinale TaxID=1796646 RepID=UPI0025B6C23B|nr:hypothetical protein [Muribaculum intestinale]
MPGDKNSNPIPSNTTPLHTNPTPSPTPAGGYAWLAASTEKLYPAPPRYCF